MSFRSRILGETDNRGVVLLSMHGSEGDRVELLVGCPAGFLSPSKPVEVLLHRLAEPNRPAEYQVRCPPVHRGVVVVVRAENGPNLPVMLLGREVARTDESGVAHALIEVAANDQLEMMLRTDEPGGERLRPQNPVMKFTIADRDDMRLFDVHFEVEPRKRRWRAAPLLPVRLH